MKKLHTPLLLFSLCMGWQLLQAQTETPKFSVNGAARSIFYLDNLEQDLPELDTITPPRASSAHALVDLGINIRPADNIEVQGMVRIRNDFGGFWGSGVTFDIRQLYVKGVLKDVVRYQLGDINYQLTPYTMYNNDQELSENSPLVFDHLTDVIRYDNFYNTEHYWRQQGAAIDFGLNFKSVIETMEFNVFTSRIAASNISSINDRLFSTFNVGIIQSKYLTLGLNYANLYDLQGTSRNDQLLSNPVLTGNVALQWKKENIKLTAAAETGTSQTIYKEDENAPELQDVFFDGHIAIQYTPVNLQLTLGFKSVGPEFRSPGAQTKRINFGSYPAAYERITNDQVIRPLTMMDLMRETSLYNLQIQNGLMDFNPLYDNITPYGAATPNRQGIHLALAYQTKDNNLEANASMDMLTEIKGQGTTNLRSFNRMELGAVYHAGADLLNSKRLLDVSIHMRMDQTNRDVEDEGIPQVNLATNVIGVGLEAEIIQQLDLVAGVQMHSFSGFEFSTKTDAYGQIINFVEMEAEGQQQMLGTGLRFRFSDKVYLMGQYNRFDYSNSTNEIIPDYGVNQLALIYSMKF